MLRAKNLNKQIRETKILQNVSFELAPGEIICVIGPSGAGKTSLLRALSLIDPPDKGSLAVDHREYTFPVVPAEYPYPELTVVFQQLFIWPHLTIRENLLLPQRGVADAEYFDEVIGLFKMHDFLDKHPNEISIGQRQRTALARALLLKPKYLLLDEVTSALDIEQAHLILKHLKQIALSGVGVVFVTHALHLASKISNRVVFLDHGVVVESGTSDILSAPKTSRLKQFVEASHEVV